MQENTPSNQKEPPLTLSVISPTAKSDSADPQADAIAHLANERTFLAWSFVAMALIGSGVALARTLIALNAPWWIPKGPGIIPVLFHPTTMGLLLLGAGFVVMVMATCRYLSVQKQISEQQYRPSETLAMMLLIIVVALGVLLAGFLFQLSEGYV